MFATRRQCNYKQHRVASVAVESSHIARDLVYTITTASDYRGVRVTPKLLIQKVKQRISFSDSSWSVVCPPRLSHVVFQLLQGVVILYSRFLAQLWIRF